MISESQIDRYVALVRELSRGDTHCKYHVWDEVTNLADKLERSLEADLRSAAADRRWRVETANGQAA
jgi:predicted glycoside hydrolase/deacetylase ChbG (UPF0249 family)